MRFCPCRLSVVPFALLCGCVGLRTPLDEAAIPDADFCKTPSATHTTHTTHATADVLIVLDRSESMTFALGSDTTCSGTNCTSRLSAISSAVPRFVVRVMHRAWRTASRGTIGSSPDEPPAQPILPSSRRR